MATAHKQLHDEAEAYLSQHDIRALTPRILLQLVAGARADVGPILEDNPTIQQLVQLSPRELAQYEGIGEQTAVRIAAALQLALHVQWHSEEKPQVATPADVANIMIAEYYGATQEMLKVLLLDTRGRVIKIPTLYMGSLNTSVIRVGELFKWAIRENAAAIIITHNHPSGDPTPSTEDIAVTRQIIEAGNLLDIPVMDHIIIANARYVSLKERGLAFCDK